MNQWNERTNRTAYRRTLETTSKSFTATANDILRIRSNYYIVLLMVWNGIWRCHGLKQRDSSSNNSCGNISITRTKFYSRNIFDFDLIKISPSYLHRWCWLASLSVFGKLNRYPWRCLCTISLRKKEEEKRRRNSPANAKWCKVVCKFAISPLPISVWNGWCAHMNESEKRFLKVRSSRKNDNLPVDALELPSNASAL